MDNAITGKSIVLFDGICCLCNASVDFIIRHDKADRFRFASLQSDFAKELLKEFNHEGSPLDSVCLVEHGKIYFKSTAALRIFKGLGGGWKSVYAFIILPKFIRDPVYNLISDNRYRIFGKRECRIPTPEEKNKIIE